jgi:hypothetical protein
MLAVAVPNARYQRPGATPTWLWAGLWHGVICPITLVVRLFAPTARIYAVNNRGRLYELGFLLGAARA